MKRFSILLLCALALSCFAGRTSPTNTFALHSAAVTGSYKDSAGRFVSLNASARTYDSDTTHFQQGLLGIGGASVRFNSSAMTVAVLSPTSATINYDGTYWPATPSKGAGIASHAVLTVDKAKHVTEQITADADGAVLYSYQGVLASGSVTLL